MNHFLTNSEQTGLYNEVVTHIIHLLYSYRMCLFFSGSCTTEAMDNINTRQQSGCELTLDFMEYAMLWPILGRVGYRSIYNGHADVGFVWIYSCYRHMTWLQFFCWSWYIFEAYKLATKSTWQWRYPKFCLLVRTCLFQEGDYSYTTNTTFAKEATFGGNPLPDFLIQIL